MSIRCIINGQPVETHQPPITRAVDFIRGHLHLTGIKEGCGEGECGACTILMGELNHGGIHYKTTAACLLPLGELEGKHVVTIEGLNPRYTQNQPLNTAPRPLSPIQQALVDEGASQCGFCAPGIVMSLTGFFLNSRSLDYTEGVRALDGNLCRCTGYIPICRALVKLRDTFAPRLDPNKNRIQQLTEWSLLPNYFLLVQDQLKEINPEGKEKENNGKHKKIIVAGGTDLFVQRPPETDEANAPAIEFISRRRDLKGIQKKDNWLVIGAATTVEELKQSMMLEEYFPGLPDSLNLFGSTLMRNRATVAGNIVNASPIGDLSIIFLALNADLSLVKGDQQRRQVPLREFFKGYKKIDLKKGELIEAIEIPLPEPETDCQFHFEKVARRQCLDIASCNTAISISLAGDVITSVHLSAGGVAPVPLYLEETCAWLRGKEITPQILQKATEIMIREITPISDVRGSAPYKVLLLRNLVLAHFMTLFPGGTMEEEFLGGMDQWQIHPMTERVLHPMEA